MVRKHILLNGVALLGLVSGSASYAQSQPDTAGSETSETRDEIIVTARKVQESVQDIPLAITAFSAKDIADKSISDLEDVAMLTPGLVFEDYSNGGFGSPTIRGATQFAVTGLEQNVSVFLDGVYIPRQYAFDVGSMNLDRIEVVKGPQSALYGANAFVGAINYITTGRSLVDTTAHAEVSLSENGGLELIGKVNAVIVPDVFGVRAAGGYSRFGGDWANNHPDAKANVSPGTDETFGGYKKWSAQLGITVRPVEGLTFDLDYYHFDTLSEVKAQYRLTRANRDTNCSNGVVFGQRVQQLYCGTIPNVPIPGASRVTGLVGDPRTFGIDSKTDMIRAAANYALSDEISFAYQYGHIEGDVFSAGSNDRDPLIATAFGPASGNVFSFVPAGGFSYDSHEARLQYAGKNGLYGMVGVFVQDGEDFERQAFGLVPFRGLTPFRDFLPGASITNGLTETKAKAVFGRIAVPLFDERLILSAEGRYTDETKTLTTTTTPVSSTARFEYKDEYFTPRFGIDYKISPDNLIYISVAKGVKSGGINLTPFAGLLPSQRFYGPDTNWSYEIGSKNTFAGGRGLLNIALFKIDWSNLQLPSTPIGAPANSPSITTNLGGASSKGVEIEAEYEVIDGLTFNGGLAYTDAKYDKGTISARITRAALCDNVICPANGDIGGNEIQRTAKWQWNIGAAYNQELTTDMDFFARVDVAGQSKQYVEEINVAIIEPRTLVNARLGIKGEGWTAALWAKNLFNERYVANALFIANPFQVDYVPSLGNKRRAGITLSYDF